MWFFLFLIHIFVCIEPANLQHRGRAILRNWDNRANPCEGIVEVYYNGTPGYVGDKFWDEKTEAVVCKITHCGRRNSSEDEYRSTEVHKVWLNELQCDGKEESLWDCPGWPGPGLSFYQKPTVKKIKCSNEIKLSLTKGKCAGAVQYNTSQETGYFCGDNWGEREGELLCQSLGCGGFKQLPNPEWMMTNDFHQSNRMKINCSGIDRVDHLWQCVTEKSSVCTYPASVVCNAEMRVQLKGKKANRCSGFLEYEGKNGEWKRERSNDSADTLCRKMHCGGAPAQDVPQVNNNTQITCKDKVEVVLMDREKKSKCYGSVSIEVNGETKSVCASSWTDKEAQMVCAELKCGKMISTSMRRTSWGIMDHVNCTGSESSLWHCNAKHGENIPCSATPYVVCANSINATLVDGPGRCAGRLEVYNEGQWRRISKSSQLSYPDLVCKQLNCGTTGSVAMNAFSQGSGDFLSLNCRSNAQHISDCIQSDQSNNRDERDSVGIICKEHELVYLKGSKSCSGTVMIEQGDASYWLSGSNETWNQESANTVCKQMHCGEASNYTSQPSPNEDIDVWHKSYNCKSTKESLFKCNNYSSLPPDHNETMAYVECSGTIHMNLSNGCWGTVNICAGGKCGGLCSDTWTDEKSEKLCFSLGCRDKSLPLLRQRGTSKVLFMSIHTPKRTNLSQSIFVKKEGMCTPASVVCAGSIKPRLSSSRDKCAGNVEVNYEGSWLPVSANALADTKTQNTICKELKCGTAVNKPVPYFGPTPALNDVVTSLDCPNNAASLAACDISLKNQKENLAGLQCSEWRTIALEVQDTCKGDVVVYSKQSRSVMFSQKLNASEGQRLCKDMNCGDFLQPNSHKVQTRLPLWNKTFSCPAQGKIENIWDCETETTASQQNQPLYVECEDKSKVTLSKTCRGEVKINNIEICNQNWKMEYAHRVCQEMDCGNAIVGSESKPDAKSGQKYFHVSCDDHHYKLDQCKRVEGTCSGKLVNISCIGNVQFKTHETCGGVILVNYRNDWEYVCNEQFPENVKNMLCQQINCTSSIALTKEAPISTEKFPETGLECPRDCNDIRYCVKPKSCGDRKLATIYCQGYKPRDKPSQPTTPSSTTSWPIVVVVVLLVICIVAFVRFYLLRRAKEKRIPPGMLPEEDVEFESGKYEVVNSDEMEERSLGRFRPEAEFLKEKDEQSVSSLPYDDIDEVAESQLLNRQGSIVASPRVLNQSDDGVNYDVDQSQDNYDDIDTCPEVSQTAAEVHDGPRTTPESDAEVLQKPVQKDEDYLVPGQDG